MACICSFLGSESSRKSRNLDYDGEMDIYSMFKRNNSTNFDKDSTKPNSLFKDNTLINYDIKNQTNNGNLNSLKVETQEENIDLSNLESDESSLKSADSLPQSYSEMTELYPDYNYDIEYERTDETETGTKDFSEDNYENERTDETETKTKDIQEDNYDEEEHWLDYPNLSKQNNDFDHIQNATNDIVAMLNDVIYSAQVSNSTRDSISNDVEEKTNSKKSVLNESDAFDSIQRTNCKGSMLKDSDIKSLQKTANVLVSTMSKQNDYTNIDTSGKQSMSNQNGDYVSVQKANANEKQSLLNETDISDYIKKTLHDKESMYKHADDVEHVQRATHSKESVNNDEVKPLQKTINGTQSMLDVGSVQRTPKNKESMFSETDSKNNSNDFVGRMEFESRKLVAHSTDSMSNDTNVESDKRASISNYKYSMFGKTDSNNNSDKFVERLGLDFEPRKLIVSVNDLKLQFQSLVDQWKTKLQTDQTNSTAAPGKTHYSGSILM
jgi:hypothetical protein